MNLHGNENEMNGNSASQGGSVTIADNKDHSVIAMIVIVVFSFFFLLQLIQLGSMLYLSHGQAALIQQINQHITVDHQN